MGCCEAPGIDEQGFRYPPIQRRLAKYQVAEKGGKGCSTSDKAINLFMNCLRQLETKQKGEPVYA